MPQITTDQNRDREILSECPRCRLPIYTTDQRDWLALPGETHASLYHGGCAWRHQVNYHSERAQEAARELRKLGVTVRLELQVPVV